MKEPMKCERLVYEWETQEITGYNKEENAVTVKTNKHKQVCNGEMEDKGILPLSEFGMVVGTQIIRQCAKCKDIKIV